MTQEQKNDILQVFGKNWKNVGNIDYVAGWYLKSAQMMKLNSAIRASLVSTNSITQGEQVVAIWKPLFEQYGIHFDFAYRTFRWDSEASIKAHVHCVIIGFSISHNGKRIIYLSDNQYLEAKNINGYLIDGDNIFVENYSQPICKDAPKARSGNKPIDDGNYLFTVVEKEEFIKLEPESEKYFRPWIGSYEFINKVPRYCLWLGDCSPAQLRQMPECLKRVENVRNFRLASKSEGTRKLADKPTRFHVETFLEQSYLIMPLTSSERRRYVPIGFITPDYIASNLVVVVSNASIYHFGVITSNVFMAWMRVVCGRLKSDYRITKDNVYNNFPWPSITPEQEAEISRTAQAILDARNLYPDCSLADLYDEVTMPVELRRAHQANDRAVMRAYGLPITTSESDTVAHLFKLYEELTKK
jgi:hypothetical protein